MNDFILLIVGGVLTVIGGAANGEINARAERKRELEAIKSALADELGGMETTLQHMHEVWEKSKVLHSSYLADLMSDTAAFEAFRLRFFLIEDVTLRKEIVAFYKKVSALVNKNQEKVGSLGNSPDVQAEQAAIEASFQTLVTEAKTIRGKLEA